jgi:hypothetical protein
MSLKASTLTGAGFTAGSVNPQDGSTPYTKTVGGITVTATLFTEGNSTAGYSGIITVNATGDTTGADFTSVNALLVTLGLYPAGNAIFYGPTLPPSAITDGGTGSAGSGAPTVWSRSF